MVGHRIVISTEAPYDVVVELWTVDRQFALYVHTIATTASLLTTTIAVGNQISLTVTWVVATCNP